jgi:hypothetical protein
MLGPDARVEHAHHDALAGALTASKCAPGSGRADESRAGVGGDLEQLVWKHLLHPGEPGEIFHRVLGQDHGHAAEDQRKAVRDDGPGHGVPAGGFEALLLPAEVLEVCPAARRVEV